VPQVPVSASPVKISCARIHHDVLTAADDVDAVAGFVSADPGAGGAVSWWPAQRADLIANVMPG
jgi:hypothetical protein